jgi:hypothetical protein
LASLQLAPTLCQSDPKPNTGKQQCHQALVNLIQQQHFVALSRLFTEQFTAHGKITHEKMIHLQIVASSFK